MITGPFIILATVAVALLAALLLTRHKLRKLSNDSRFEIESARTRFDREISDARAERNRLLDALDDAFLLVDADGRIRFANAAAHRLFSGRELFRRPAREVLLEPRLADPLFLCLETGEAVQSQVVLPQQSSPRGDQEARGANAWLIDAARLPAQEGDEPVTRLIIRDVTIEHQTDQVRKDFVANASHELRTPMAIINGYLENLLDDNMVDDPRMARRFLAVMRKHAERISRIVEDMLVISRLESGEAAALKIEPFRLRSCVNDVLERLESVIRSQEAEIVIAMSDEDFTMLGDRFYWTQVLFNLVENALKQNPHSGLRIGIGCESGPDALRVWVSDNGVGIPIADLPHIFRRFYRVGKHHSQQEIKGTGLGLSIVKRAVEAHGGNITVTSVPGRETRFLITLPTPPPAREN